MQQILVVQAATNSGSFYY